MLSSRLKQPESKNKLNTDSSAAANNLLLSRVEHTQLKKLSSWQKNYQLPQEQNSTTRLFLAELCSTQLKDEIDTMYQAIKKELSFKRKELVSSVSEDATAAIITPDFSYSLSVELNPTNTSEIVWIRNLDKLSDLRLLNNSAFAAVFDNCFDSISLLFSERIIVSDFIDQIEEKELSQITLHYDPECTYCELQIKHSDNSKIRVTTNSLSIQHQETTQISRIAESFETIQLLISQNILSLPLK